MPSAVRRLPQSLRDINRDVLLVQARGPGRPEVRPAMTCVDDDAPDTQREGRHGQSLRFGKGCDGGALSAGFLTDGAWRGAGCSDAGHEAQRADETEKEQHRRRPRSPQRGKPPTSTQRLRKLAADRRDVVFDGLPEEPRLEGLGFAHQCNRTSKGRAARPRVRSNNHATRHVAAPARITCIFRRSTVAPPGVRLVSGMSVRTPDRCRTSGV